MAIPDDKKRIVISLKKEQLSKLENKANSIGLSKSAIIVLALEKYLKEQNQ
ncbi:TPA: CopG family transcriptional regulator [Enterococcus faecium]|uniref:ribbon-helix-helix domain-containing protein n=1 Tax=Enterococcus faecium TaxID=1352 RepID=UPI0002A37177|nr:CopG family transcriptional regulator [Enterococcus faecium]ELA82989.1 hypothetical protein OI3_05075 [Enterococcus faecium EnGen0021]EOM01361.1 hypothetical protein U9S_02474 [Enterococcus faecium EnGen0259]